MGKGKKEVRLNMDDTIKHLIKEESDLAKNLYEPFNSPYEGYAVLKEELEEVEDYTDDLDTDLALMWQYIKMGETDKSVIVAEKLQSVCRQAMKEIIQVAAMSDRYITRFKDQKTHKNDKPLK